MTDEDAPSPGRGTVWLLAAACLILFALAYGNSLDNSFHFDDSHVIENNLYIRSLSNIPRFFRDARTFSSVPANSTYRPLLSVTYAIDYRLGHGLAPRQFHLTQLLLMVLLALLITLLWRRVMDRAGPDPMNAFWTVFAAGLFALHTANSETMNLISARSDIISTLAIVAGLLIYDRFPRLRVWQIHLIPMIVGSLAKAPAVFYAPLLLAWVWLGLDGASERESTPARRAVRASWPAFVAGVAMLFFLNAMNAPQWVAGGGSRSRYVLTQLFVWLHYARLFLLPLGLTADTDMPLLEHWWDTRVIAGAVFILLLAVAARRASKRPEDRPIAFGLIWFAVALIPTSSFFPLAEVANEHRIFFPYVGACLAFAWWLKRYGVPWLARVTASSDRETAVVCCVVILAAHAAGTHARNRTWKTEESLWLDVTEKSPQNGRGLMNYGLTQMSRGNYALARQYFDRAEILTPNYPTLEINQGVVTGAMGDQVTAEGHFRRALQLGGGSDASFFYARWLIDRGRAPEAIPLLEKSVALSPAGTTPRQLLMDLYAARGDLQDAQRVARDVLNIDPSSGRAAAYLRGSFSAAEGQSYDALLMLGLRSGAAGQHLAEVLSYRGALRMRPASADAWNNLGWGLEALGFLPEADDAYDRALRFQPDYQRARNNLALLRQRMSAR
jgi:tetratricopeptide (TPR) repeat protein